MEQQSLINYNQAIQSIKRAILQSRYRAAVFANREMLSLYFSIGKFISENSRNHFWGTNALETISVSLQQELPGLRGFSVTNLKNMRSFYEAWNYIIDYQSEFYCIDKKLASSSATGAFRQDENRQAVTDEIDINILIRNRQAVTDDSPTANRPTLTDDFQRINFDHFLSIGFTHHNEILSKTRTLPERLFLY
jgi:hypothetical protein